MKNIINIGGAILFLVFLMKGKKSEGTPPILPTKGGVLLADNDQTPPIRIEQEYPEVIARETNNSISPDLTTYEISENQKLINALNSHNHVNTDEDNTDGKDGAGGSEHQGNTGGLG